MLNHTAETLQTAPHSTHCKGCTHCALHTTHTGFTAFGHSTKHNSTNQHMTNRHINSLKSRHSTCRTKQHPDKTTPRHPTPRRNKIIKNRTHNIFFFTQFLVLVIFTESALRPIQSISCDVRLFVCLSLCLWLCPSHPRNHASRRIRDLWSKGVSLILAYL